MSRSANRYMSKVKGNLKKEVAKATKKAVLKQAEVKMHEQQGEEVTISTLSNLNTIKCVNEIAVGNDASRRIGKKVRAKGLMLRYALDNAEGVPQYVRVMLVRGTGDELGDMNKFFRGLSGANANRTGKVIDMVSGIQYSRYQVLMDRTHKLGTSVAGDASRASYAKKYVALKNSDVVWDPSDNIPNKGPLYLVCFNAETPDDDITGRRIEFTYRTNFTFYDM